LTVLEESFSALLRRTGDAERQLLEQRVETQVNIQRQIIEANVQRDRQHLAIVNFVVTRFESGYYIHTKTGYAWIKVEPLFGLGGKSFDVAIYNNQSKVMILVECKSGLSDARREIKEILEKTQNAYDSKESLSEMVGDDIASLEFAVCVKAGLAPAARTAVLAVGAPVCIWEADIFGPSLFVDLHGQDSTTEISLGRLHHDEKLRRNLLEGIKEAKAGRQIAFLPSSHMCTILEEVTPFLRLKLERTQNQGGEFSLEDIENLTKLEISLQNFDAKERKVLAEKILISGINADIFIDLTEEQTDLSLKKLKLASQVKSGRQFNKDCHEKYVRHSARETVLQKVIAELNNKLPRLEKFAST